jgi:uncharacterized membrane protein YczE
VKTVFDLSCVTVAVVASLILLHTIAGVGIGTVICATCTGFVVKWLMPFVKPMDKYLSR